MKSVLSVCFKYMHKKQSNMKHQLCCIGHITHDKIITPRRTAHQPGGTSYYFSHAIRCLPEIDYMLVTALGAEDMHVVDELRREGIQVKVMPSRQSVYFENIYGENQDNRTQHVLAKADPFTVEYLQDVEAQIFHLGSLLADDFSLEVVKYLSGKGRISIDAQGYLREVQGEDVFPVDWERKEEFLRHVYFLKANEPETLALTGTNDPMVAAVQLHAWGVKRHLYDRLSLWPRQRVEYRRRRPLCRCHVDVEDRGHRSFLWNCGRYPPLHGDRRMRLSLHFLI